MRNVCCVEIEYVGILEKRANASCALFTGEHSIMGFQVVGVILKKIGP